MANMTKPTPAQIRAPVGWVLYDGSCGICSRSMRWWSPTCAKLGLEMTALQEPWIAERTRLSPDELLRDISILLSDGTLVRGADAYRWALRRRWWGLPLWVLVVVPPGRWLFDLGYRLFANNRQRISAACRLPPRPMP
jgi:predicted DCC family thiol-disulfide oxidoreductase YuxK